MDWFLCDNVLHHESVKNIYFLDRISLFVLLIATTFFNFRELHRSSKRLLQNTWPGFDIVFARLGVIPRARNTFVKIVAAEECYLILTHM